MKQLFTVALFLSIALISNAQRIPEFRVVVNGNLRGPANSGSKNDGIKFGGFGAGLSHFNPLNEHLDLKTSVNFSRQVYWNNPMNLNKGPNPQDQLGYTIPKTSEYYSSVSAIVHRVFENHFSIGAGVGLQFLWSSTKKIDTGLGTSAKVKNREFKPIMPVIPFEVSWKGDLMLYNLRLEGGLLNRYRNDLTAYGSNFYSLLSFEIGMKL